VSLVFFLVFLVVEKSTTRNTRKNTRGTRKRFSLSGDTIMNYEVKKLLAEWES